MPGVPPMLPNPCLLIGHMSQKRLKMFCNFVHYADKVQHDMTAALASLANITSLSRFLKQEEEHDNSINLPAKLTSIDSIRASLEKLDQYLKQKHGKTGIPLAACTRERIDLPTGTLDDPDPGFGELPFLWEMVQCGPHVGDTYKSDNTMVWDTIMHMTHAGSAWGWVQSLA